MVKVPPGSGKPLTYNKDRTKTRRTVKGAAGGMKGVDYEDDRRADPTTTPATSGKGSNRVGQGPHRVDPSHMPIGENVDEAMLAKLHAPKEEGEMILDDEDAITRDMKARLRAKHVVPRDRLTIDKDAPELLRRRKWEFEDEESEEEIEQPEEIDLEAIAEAIASADDDPQERGHLFDSDKATLGDPSLTDPDQIREALGSPISYAKHSMILSACFRRATGASREEAIAYLASMFVSVSERAFGRMALREFGPSTGIVDIYPLEVIERVLTAHPGFLSKHGFGRIFSKTRNRPDTPISMVVDRPCVLRYPADLIIRGFALKGGGHPGYRFEPAATPGEYHLTVSAPGPFALLVSAITRSGYTVIDRLNTEVRVARGTSGRQASSAAPSEESLLPPRDQAKIDAWPMPIPPPIDYEQVLEDEEPDDEGFITSGELVHRQQVGAMRGPKGAAEDDHSFEEWPQVPEEEPAPANERALTTAEASLLKMAFAIKVRPEDIKAGFSEPEELPPSRAPSYSKPRAHTPPPRASSPPARIRRNSSGSPHRRPSVPPTEKPAPLASSATTEPESSQEVPAFPEATAKEAPPPFEPPAPQAAGFGTPNAMEDTLDEEDEPIEELEALQESMLETLDGGPMPQALQTEGTEAQQPVVSAPGFLDADPSPFDEDTPVEEPEASALDDFEVLEELPVEEFEEIEEIEEAPSDLGALTADLVLSPSEAKLPNVIPSGLMDESLDGGTSPEQTQPEADHADED